MDETPTQADWQRWLDEQAPRFLLFARQQARSEADAHDLVQDALVEACGRSGQPLPPAPALVFATIRRRAIDQARRDARRAQREALSAPGDSAWFDTGLEERESSVLLQDAMSKLPDMYREVITLKIWGELTFAEVAEVLGVPANTAASRYRYGLQELRKLTKGVLT